MKNILLGLLLGVSIMLSVNAITTPTTITTKPAQPKAWVTQCGSSYVIEDLIMKYSKQGYIVDKLSYGGYGGQAFVLMYKYY